ncbi:MAG TPA: CpaF family protein, partial [Chloroflexaceae bacterium]|nr:CpaF family protein [Chloroflexaceae bacterium]
METMCLMAGMDLPSRAIREQIAAAVHIIVHVERHQDGSRRLGRICEITGLEGDVITMSDIFHFKHAGLVDGRVTGQFVPTGIRPRCMERFQQHNIALSPQIFGFGAKQGGR